LIEGIDPLGLLGGVPQDYVVHGDTLVANALQHLSSKGTVDPVTDIFPACQEALIESVLQHRQNYMKLQAAVCKGGLTSKRKSLHDSYDTESHSQSIFDVSTDSNAKRPRVQSEQSLYKDNS
jgi:hypothetical protein